MVAAAWVLVVWLAAPGAVPHAFVLPSGEECNAALETAKFQEPTLWGYCLPLEAA